MVEEKYPADWNKRRRTIFNRYDWECQDCGDHIPQDSEKALHAHHVRPISEGGGHSLDNLLPLCEGCHVEIHASDQVWDLLPRETYDCAHCDFTYVEGTSFKGSFCSKDCWLTHKAEKQVSWINNTDWVCSTCFAEIPPGTDICPRCDNFEPNENRREELEVTDLDLVNLCRHIIKNYEN